MPGPDAHPSFHRITALDVFQFAGPLQKVVVIALLAAMGAAIVVLAVKLASGRKLDGGSAFLSSLRLGAPILGGLGACWSLFNMTLGYAGVPGDPSPKIMAPGFAEAFLQVGLGFLVGTVAVLCHWAVTSRIDRQVLGV